MKRILITGFFLFIVGCGEESSKIQIHLKPLSSDISIRSADLLNFEVWSNSETKIFSHSLKDSDSFEFKGAWDDDISVSVEGMKGSEVIFFGISAPFYPWEVKDKIYIPVYVEDEFRRVPEFSGISPEWICGNKNGFVAIGDNGIFRVNLLSFKMERIYESIEDGCGCAFTSDGILIGRKGKVLYLKEGEYKEYDLGGIEKFSIFSAGKYAVISGGLSSGKKSAESYIFKDGDLKKWKNMNSPRAGHIAIPLDNGDFLIAGGGGEPEIWRNEKMNFEKFSASRTIGDVSAGLFLDNKIFLIKKDTGELLEIELLSGKVNSSAIFNGVHGAGDGRLGMFVNNEGDVLILPDLKTFHIEEIEASNNKIYSTRGIFMVVSKRGFYIYMKKEVLK